jgi:hypothetical protein
MGVPSFTQPPLYCSSSSCCSPITSTVVPVCSPSMLIQLIDLLLFLGQNPSTMYVYSKEEQMRDACMMMPACSNNNNTRTSEKYFPIRKWMSSPFPLSIFVCFLIELVPFRPPKKRTVLPFENGCLPFFESIRSHSRKDSLPIFIGLSPYHQWTYPISYGLQSYQNQRKSILLQLTAKCLTIYV